MVILLLLGIVLTGVAVMAAARTVAFGVLRRRETLAQIDAYGFQGVDVAPRERRSLKELVERLVTAIGRLALKHLNPEHEAKLRSLLRAAGYYGTEPATFLGYRITLAVFVPFLWLVLLTEAGALGARAVVGIGMLAGLGWVMPKFVLERRATKRLQDIDREMPELVDLLVTTVEAGVGFASSLQLVARRVEGPLGQELRLALQEQSMGMTIEDALKHMLSRVDSASVRAFVQAILQGQTLGVSIGKILRDLAVDMRKRRRQVAEERAQKAPTKILFPLVILILPALLIVALGGPLLGLMQNLASA
ncbi:MAG TPA: type II secretion system F family protein [Gaiellaceae bacterium]|nr:type II secretion system F family protein [Gaiellaceae bacterium]